ncbi:DegT/DnrJ/EryC1/StrS family aminotransferase [Erwinia pyrifoliae]|uniref:DegT/DnrJ/EryC1/StrS family aminotransferase n=1 Tax=Erwinia pyrifoliae TaxID=79967 RepID=UPI00019610D7|nr:DegT/DnrJ/EryC1/StrS family aminotransferase [Erwinia pyrifoliae]AUX73494.1 DegT/DnrJ/EryC1/StrS family aminotransferase [Erwinia pyrifoliae]MCA8876205.1 DegT/DnrJ/EryC1/StrS family aminotransferase [Erwinia pyrifoliae]UXK11458.1 DegT/DnrJ/EryC1/StrS family aminotransferase [Erwinia pyrifoliae]CAX54726.1 Pyridoxal phosphate-dependent transferase [Erwinia pyrifoliae Ep1/96]CAY73378.1 aminotransferase, DegT/DnrJ/EryC1/StrS family [Erwinia pyrifoliae DSM 12163]
MQSDKKIYVTRPLMPPLEEFVPYLEQIWHNQQLTNNGPCHQQLEQALADYLGVQHISLFSNGTLALLTALQALRVSGEVLTTPYSFVATAHSLLWNGLTPVFVDTEADGFNIDAEKLEQAITARTTAIMPVHCYGVPCNTARIGQIADLYGLKVIYDAAHAFGVQQQGRSVLLEGDLSVVSFHATKVFNTIEGGAIISHDASMKRRIDLLKNFGIADETTVVAAGINGKMNELQAAYGLLQLKHIDCAIAQRAASDQQYRQGLAQIGGISVPAIPAGIKWNYAYFPIVVEAEYALSRDQLYQALIAHNIIPRRYFYPLISHFHMYKDVPGAQAENLLNAHRAAGRVICLPLYPGLEEETIARIVQIIRYHSANA